MSVRQYIGARYVPRFSDVNGGVWSNVYSYEPLTIVKNGNDYYTSKQSVPVGIAITNTEYWVKTGDYNGAIASLDAKIGELGNLKSLDKTSIVNAINSVIDTDYANVKYFGAVGDGIVDDTTAFRTAIATGRTVYIPAGTYKITDTLTLNSQSLVCDTNGVITGAFTGVLFNLTGQDNIITGLNVSGDNTITVIKIDDSPFNKICNCKFNNIGNGIDILATGNMFVNVIMEGIAGIGIHISEGNDNYFVNVISDCINSTGHSIIMEQTHADQTESNLFTQCSFLRGAESQLKANVRFSIFTDCFFDHMGIFSDSGESTRYIGCWFANRVNNGAMVSGNDISFINCTFQDCVNYGLFIMAASQNTTVESCSFMSCSIGGVIIEQGSLFNSIRGCLFKQLSVRHFYDTMYRGVHTPGSPSKYIIKDNRFIDLTTPIASGFANIEAEGKIVKDNIHTD